MTPMLIQQGFLAIVVCFDVWDIANMTAGLLKQGRELAANK
jgi:hypothetical protein